MTEGTTPQVTMAPAPGRGTLMSLGQRPCGMFSAKHWSIALVTTKVLRTPSVHPDEGGKSTTTPRVHLTNKKPITELHINDTLARYELQVQRDSTEHTL